jgi:hypothetical protein
MCDSTSFPTLPRLDVLVIIRKKNKIPYGVIQILLQAYKDIDSEVNVDKDT